MQLSNLSPQQLLKAANLLERMAALQTELNQLLGTAAPSTAGWPKARGGRAAAKPRQAPKRKVSAAGRKRLSQIAKARWAKVKAAGRSKL